MSFILCLACTVEPAKTRAEVCWKCNYLKFWLVLNQTGIFPFFFPSLCSKGAELILLSSCKELRSFQSLNDLLNNYSQERGC